MTIVRYEERPRMAQAVVHGNVVYLAGQVGRDHRAPVAEQTRQTLSEIDRYC